MSSEAAVPMELEMTRFFRAPRAMVWRAWTDPEQLAHWWGPKVFTNPRCELELRVGGKLHIDMRAPNGVLYPMGGEVLEIVPEEKLVFLAWALDEKGERTLTNHTSASFKHVDGGTEILLQIRVVSANATGVNQLKGMREGWTGSFEKLAALIEKINPVVQG